MAICATQQCFNDLVPRLRHEMNIANEARSRPSHPTYPHTPTRGELTTGRSISSPHLCSAAQSSQSHPSSGYSQYVHIYVAGSPQFSHNIGYTRYPYLTDRLFGCLENPKKTTTYLIPNPLITTHKKRTILSWVN